MREANHRTGHKAAALAGLHAEIATQSAAIEQQVIAWRRDVHQHPELGNREFRTSALVASVLCERGLEVVEGIGGTGVLGILRGGAPGKTVVLRAELDALPITEQTDVPFASTVTTMYNGVVTGVGHMCGHDCHVAILLGVAHVLSKAPRTWSGTVVFLFQPSEEGAPDGEDGGASVMLKDGRLTAMRPDAFFALHVISNMPVGTVAYRAGAALASSDIFRIRVDGKQTHSGYPWTGIDPIVSAAQIVLGLQTIESRQVAVTEEPSVLSVCMINGGIKENVIPASVELAGTLRAFDEAMREDIHLRIARVAECIACSCGATARTTIRPLYPVTVNHPELTRRIIPSLRRIVGADNVFEAGKLSASEDFGIFLRNYPGSIFYLGCAPAGIDLRSAAINHSPLFFVDETALLLGMKCMATVAIDFLADFALDVGGPVPVCSSVL